MNLLVDIGNSRIKWAQQSEAGLQPYSACTYDEANPLESLESCWHKLSRPRQVYVSNVAGKKIADEISACLDRLWAMTPVFLSVSRQAAGVMNGYDDINQLGVDRWLAMIAAWNRYQSPVCVVDCGTAMTIDVVRASGQHAGGVIVPGLSLMSSVLNSQTQQIDSSLNPELSTALGQNTRDCVSNGALISTISLIKYMLERVMSEHGKSSRCIITGGYAEEIQGFLEFDYDYDPNLVLNGMALLIDKL